MTQVTTIIKYLLADTAGVVGQQPFKKKARFDQILEWNCVDKLNKIREFNYTVPNDEFHRANAIIERKIFVSFVTPFRGLIVGESKDESTISIKAKEFATHLERRYFKVDDEKRVTYTDTDWFDGEWKFRRKCKVNKDLVEDEIKEFPLLFSVTLNTGIKNRALSSGNDILFTAKDGKTKLAHEIEKYDSQTGELVAHVKIPKVSDSSNTEFFIYYGNPNATDQQDIINVWKGTNKLGTEVSHDYAMVQHLNEDPTDTPPEYLDSTENNNDGTETSVTRVTGKIGFATDYDGVGSKIDCGSDTTIDNIFIGGGWTMGWIEPDSDGEVSLGFFASKNNFTGWAVLGSAEASGLIKFSFFRDFTTTDGEWKTTNTVVPINKKTFFAVHYDEDSVSNTPTIYINNEIFTVGNGKLTVTTGPPVGSAVSDATGTLTIGNNTAQSRTADGIIDEIRLATVIPPNIDALIKTIFNNQNDPSAFITALPQEQYIARASDVTQRILDSANDDQEIVETTDISGLVSHFPFEHDMLDAFASNNGTTAVGTEQYLRGKIGRFAFDFDASTTVQIDAGLVTTLAKYTISAWVKKPTGVNPAGPVVYGEENSADTTQVKEMLWGEDFGNGNVQIRVFQRDSVNTNNNAFDSGIDLTDTNWHYITWQMKSATSLEVFVDNVSKGTATLTLSGTYSPDSNNIGSRPNDTQFYTGQIDEVRIYNKELTTTELDKIFNANNSNSNPVQKQVLWTLDQDVPGLTPTEGLITSYDFEDNVLDQTGPNNGTVTGSELYVAGKLGKGFDYDGFTDITLANEANFDFLHTDKFSFSFWLSHPGTAGNEGIITKTTGIGAIGWMMFYNTADKIRFEINDGPNIIRVGNNTAQSKNVLHHYVVTYDGSVTAAGVKIYVDKVEDSVTIIDNAPSAILNNIAVRLGSFDAGSARLSVGSILDEVKIYKDKVLNQEDVDRLFEEGSSGITTALNFKNHFESLQAVGEILGDDIFFDNEQHIVFVGTKGKTLDPEQKLDIVITSKPEKNTDDFANEINLIGNKDDLGQNIEKTVLDSTVLRFNYEKLVADNQLTTLKELDDVGSNLLKEFQKLTPQIKGEIPYNQFSRLNLGSGDIIKISQPEKQLNGSFRVMDIDVNSKKAKVSLESTETGVIRLRSLSFPDIIEGILKRIQDQSIQS